MYINNKEKIKRNMPENFDYDTYANSYSLIPKNELIELNPMECLVDGENYIAIEYHKSQYKNQAALDLMLIAFTEKITEKYEIPYLSLNRIITTEYYSIEINLIHNFIIHEVYIFNNNDFIMSISDINIITDKENINIKDTVIPNRRSGFMIFKDSIFTKAFTLKIKAGYSGLDKIDVILYTYPDDVKFCEEDGIWTYTPPGRVQYRSCYNNLLYKSGYQSRLCKNDGKWEDPDTSECEICENNKDKLYYTFSIEYSDVKSGFILKQENNIIYTSLLYDKNIIVSNYICISDYDIPIEVVRNTVPNNDEWDSKTSLVFKTINDLIIFNINKNSKNNKFSIIYFYILELPSKYTSLSWKYIDELLPDNSWLNLKYDITNWKEGSLDTIKSDKSLIYLTKIFTVNELAFNIELEIYYNSGLKIFINNYYITSINLDENDIPINQYQIIQYYHLSIPVLYINEGDKNKLNVIYYKHENSLSDYLIFDTQIILHILYSDFYYYPVNDYVINVVNNNECVTKSIIIKFNNNLDKHVSGYLLTTYNNNPLSWKISDSSGNIYDSHIDLAISKSKEFMFTSTIFINELIFIYEECSDEIFENIVLIKHLPNRICPEDNYWPISLPGNIIEMSCLYGLYDKYNTQTRLCKSSTKTWDNVNLSNCKICSSGTTKLYLYVNCTEDCDEINIDFGELGVIIFEETKEKEKNMELCFKNNEDSFINIISDIKQNVYIYLTSIGGYPLFKINIPLNKNEKYENKFDSIILGLYREKKYYTSLIVSNEWTNLNYIDNEWKSCVFPKCIGQENVYFRDKFVILNKENILYIIIEVFYNDKITLYLNGVKINTLTKSNENNIIDSISFTIQSDILVNGENIISCLYEKKLKMHGYISFDYMVYVFRGDYFVSSEGTSENQKIFYHSNELLLSCSIPTIYSFYSDISKKINKYKLYFGNDKQKNPIDWNVECYDGNSYKKIHSVNDYSVIDNSITEDSFYITKPLYCYTYRITFFNCKDDITNIKHIEYIISTEKEACSQENYWETTEINSVSKISCIINFKDKYKYQYRKCLLFDGVNKFDNIDDSNCEECDNQEVKIYIEKKNGYKSIDEGFTISSSDYDYKYVSKNNNNIDEIKLCLKPGVYNIELTGSYNNWDEDSYIKISTLTDFVLLKASKTGISKYSFTVPLNNLLSEWKYNNNNNLDNEEWYKINYDDSNWDESSEIYSESNTVYLRKIISINCNNICSVHLSILSIGGYVIYFNENRVGIYGLYENRNYNTISNTYDYPSHNNVYSIDPSLIINGNNIICIEFHKEDEKIKYIQLGVEVIINTDNIYIIPSYYRCNQQYCDSITHTYQLVTEYPSELVLEYPFDNYFNYLRINTGNITSGYCSISILSQQINLYNIESIYIDSESEINIPLQQIFYYQEIIVRINSCENSLSISEITLLLGKELTCEKDEIWPETPVNFNAFIPCNKLLLSSEGSIRRKCIYENGNAKWDTDINLSCILCDKGKEQINIKYSLNEGESFKIYKGDNDITNYKFICLEDSETYILEVKSENNDIWKYDSFVKLDNSIDMSLIYKSNSIKSLESIEFKKSIISRFSSWYVTTDNVPKTDITWKTSDNIINWDVNYTPYFSFSKVSLFMKKVIELSNVNNIGNLYIRVYCDDGVAVYINGEMIYKYNLVGLYYYSDTYANKSENLQYHDIYINNKYLKDGKNVLSLEYHKSFEKKDNNIFILDVLMVSTEFNGDSKEYIYNNILTNQNIDSTTRLLSEDDIEYTFLSDYPIYVNLIKFYDTYENTGINNALLYGYDLNDDEYLILTIDEILQPNIPGSFVITKPGYYYKYVLKINDYIKPVIPSTSISLIHSSEQWCKTSFYSPSVYKGQDILVTYGALCGEGKVGYYARKCLDNLTWSEELTIKNCELIPPSIRYENLVECYVNNSVDIVPLDESLNFIASVVITPDLPEGLLIDKNNFSISGIPTVVTPCSIYSLNFTNDVDEFITEIKICVNGPPTHGEMEDIVWFINTDMNFSPKIDFYIEYYEIYPELPDGINFNKITGVLSGKTNNLYYKRNYLIVAYNLLGSISIPFTFTIVSAPLSLLYHPDHYLFYIGREYHTSKPEYTGVITEFFVNGIKPNGLDIDDKTGIFGGIATEKTKSEIEIKITGKNPVGSVETVIYISIEDRYCLEDGLWPITSPGLWVNISCPKYYSGNIFRYCIDSSTPEWGIIEDKCVVDPPNDLRYNNNNIDMVYKEKISPITPSVNGIVKSYSINLELINGLIFSESTGEISGTPLEVGEYEYIIKAENEKGNSETSIKITVEKYLCSEDKDWPETEIDETVVHFCDDDKYGTITRMCKDVLNGNIIEAEWEASNDMDCVSKDTSLSNEQAYIFTEFRIDCDEEFNAKNQRYFITTAAEVLGELSRDIIIERYSTENNNTLHILLRWLVDIDLVDENSDKIVTLLYSPLFQRELMKKTTIYDFNSISIIETSVKMNKIKKDSSTVVAITVYSVMFGLIFIGIGSYYAYKKYKIKKLTT